MTSFLHRMLDRPSGRVARAVLIPLTALYVVVVLYVSFLVVRAGNRLDSEKLHGAAETLARTWDDRADPVNLTRLADVSDWDRIWVVSTTGRIVSSSRIGEDGAVVDSAFWSGLDADRTEVVREVRQGGVSWLQVGVRDVARGRWAMIVTRADVVGIPAWVTLTAVSVLAILLWLIMALAVVTVVHRRLGRGYDMADEMATRILGGEAISSTHLNRERAELAGEGAPSRIMALAARLQEQAERAREAESRFAASIDLTPDAAYVASFDGRLLIAGSGFRCRMSDPARPLQGRLLGSIESDLPLVRIHEAAGRLREAGVTVDRMALSSGESDVLVSLRPVSFRGIEAYLALVENQEQGVQPKAESSAPSMVRDLLDVSDDVFVAFDAEARTILWNRRAEMLTGLSRQEVPDLRRMVTLLMPSDKASRPFMDWLEAQPGAGPLDGQIRNERGEMMEIRWNAHELVTDGAVIGGVLVGRIADVAEAHSEDESPAIVSSGDGVAGSGEVVLEGIRVSGVKGSRKPKLKTVVEETHEGSVIPTQKSPGGRSKPRTASKPKSPPRAKSAEVAATKPKPTAGTTSKPKSGTRSKPAAAATKSRPTTNRNGRKSTGPAGRTSDSP